MALMIVLSIMLYAIAIVMIYHNVYSFEKKKKIQFILVSLLVVLLFTVIICNISSEQIQQENAQKIEIARNAAVLLFAPIISMILIPFLGGSLNQYHTKQIGKEQLTRRIIGSIGLLILVAIIGAGYIENFQVGLLNYANK